MSDPHSSCKIKEKAYLERINELEEINKHALERQEATNKKYYGLLAEKRQFQAQLNRVPPSKEAGMNDDSKNSV